MQQENVIKSSNRTVYAQIYENHTQNAVETVTYSIYYC